MKKKTNSNKALIITAVSLGALLLLLLAVLVGARFWMGNGGTGEQETTEPSDTHADIIVSTPFCDLSFPGKWEEQLRTEYTESDDGGAMTFTAKLGEKEAKLFTVVFGAQTSTDCAPVGVLTGGEAPVLVSLKFYEVESDASWDDSELETVFAMQDECNYLTEQLHQRPNFDENYEPYFAPEDIQIQAPFCTLTLPGQWTDQIWWEFQPSDDGGGLNVYGLVGGDDALLYTLYFGTEADGAVPIGSLGVGGADLSISLAMAEPEAAADWTAADWDDYAAMQETVNDLLSSLSEDPTFKPQ